ncbi:iron uptake transporter permease EfeU [Nonomuraea roseoviolacea]|uniref:High-affinity iron transporter n=1 Tax=Nonomuraea roseoviolacea subsp. carminata TaxID=160689 RepID=A0ABT1JUX4_9ACTN|nr:iron uptake transporter permease EfeU [Nonomuraea roseoviolacea]MCP2345556.1 high-affinity iron transporter [Nonomuraea roseoviolacea subsp. carminata]
MFASYLIGLREGLEATLVVSVLIAFLVKSDRKDGLPYVWAGIAAAVALSVGFGALLTFTAAHLGHTGQELFDAITSLLAVVFVTWMIFWMRRAARALSGELRGKLTDALQMGSLAVVVMAFLAVAREGLETALLFFASVQGATTTPEPLIGITLGLLTSVLIGWGLYRSALRINLTKFFTWTGLLLILVAAGIFKYGVHDLQEAGVLPGLTTYAFDVSAVVPADSWYGQLLAGTLNLTPQPSVLEAVAWLLYVVPTLFLFLRPQRARSTPTPASTSPAARPSA